MPQAVSHNDPLLSFVLRFVGHSDKVTDIASHLSTQKEEDQAEEGTAQSKRLCRQKHLAAGDRSTRLET